WLTTPVYLVTDGFGAQFTFRHSFGFEQGFDGGVLEVSVNGGGFSDVSTSPANAYFSEGGYNGSISPTFGNPLGGPRAFTGVSGGYITSMVSFPGLPDGTTLQLRFRLGTDVSGGGGGWLIDSVAMSGVSIGEFTGTAVLSGPGPAVYAVNDGASDYSE